MIAVIFEFVPSDDHKIEYFDTAAEMRPLVENMEGFISIERFQSLTDPDRVLSLSFWEDEAAVERWRNLAAHRNAQAKGRSRLFTDYRLRVAHVIRDYGLNDRAQAPSDSKTAHKG